MHVSGLLSAARSRGAAAATPLAQHTHVRAAPARPQLREYAQPLRAPHAAWLWPAAVGDQVHRVLWERAFRKAPGPGAARLPPCCLSWPLCVPSEAAPLPPHAVRHSPSGALAPCRPTQWPAGQWPVAWGSKQEGAPVAWGSSRSNAQLGSRCVAGQRGGWGAGQAAGARARQGLTTARPRLWLQRRPRSWCCLGCLGRGEQTRLLHCDLQVHRCASEQHAARAVPSCCHRAWRACARVAQPALQHQRAAQDASPWVVGPHVLVAPPHPMHALAPLRLAWRSRAALTATMRHGRRPGRRLNAASSRLPSVCWHTACSWQQCWSWGP